MTPGRTFRGGRTLARLRALVPALGLLLAAAAGGTALTRDSGPPSRASAAADTVPVFGPRRFESGRGRAALHVERFRAPAASGRAFLLRVAPDGAGEVRATVRLNGATLLSAALLSGARATEVPVALLADNVVEVSVDGPAGSAVRLALLQAPEAAFDVFGPRAFTRSAGAPKVETARFVLPAGAGPPFRLHLVNGEAGGSARVSSALVRLNGVQVIGPSDLGQNVGALLRDVALAVENTIEVELRGGPGGKVTLRVTATDAVPPVIEIAAPAPGAATRLREVEVAGTVRDATPTRVSVNGVEAERIGDGFRAMVPLEAEGDNALVVTAVDAAGNRADSVRTVVRDTEAPVLTVDEPEDGLVTADADVTVRGSVRDRTAVQVSVVGLPAALDASGAFATSVPLAEGDNLLAVTAADAVGNAATVARTN
ncbi:MAG TPA: hypothetical protein VHG91_21955 [Longimicrobium sp.]|nr:hypothetical protein [Longimicrobium sp.]